MLAIIRCRIHFVFQFAIQKLKKDKVRRTIILPVVWYGCETWSPEFREEQRLTLESRVLRNIFGPKRCEVTGDWRKLHKEELYDLYSSSISACSNQEEWDGRGMWHVWSRGKVRSGFRWVYVMGRDHLEGLGVGGRIILKWSSNK